MDKEDFYNWEKMSLSGIISLMVKWFGFPSVNMDVRERANVESGMWYELKIEHQHMDQVNTRYINGQRTDIVRRRLIELLDELKIREDYLKEMRGLSNAINDQLTTHTITPRIADDQVQADQAFHESLEASLQGWEAELLLIQKEQIDQAVIDAKDGARSSRYIALEKRDKDLQTMIADARTKLGKVSERVANAAFSNQVSNIVNAAKP